MATIGQIIYNLEAYDTTGGLISTKDDLSGTTCSTDSDYETKRINIFEDLVTKIESGATLSKLGIQAPPGTKVSINEDTKIIMIGRTGVYELDESIQVTSLKFQKKKRYVINQSATDIAKATGIRKLKIAENNRKAKLEGGIVNLEDATGTGTVIPDTITYSIDYNKFYNTDGTEYTPSGGWVANAYYLHKETKYQYVNGIGTYEESTTYWDDYREIQSEYDTAYAAALEYYLSGINGIYQLPNPDDESAAENFQTIYNVIVDYVKE